jgi:hypothetical protein
MRMKVQLLLVRFDRLGGISFRGQVEMFIPRAGTPSTLYLFRSYHGNEYDSVFNPNAASLSLSLELIVRVASPPEAPYFSFL